MASTTPTLLGTRTLTGVLLNVGGSALLCAAVCAAAILGTSSFHWFGLLILSPLFALVVIACIDQWRLRVVVTAEELTVTRAFGTRTLALRDLISERFINFEYCFSTRSRHGVALPLHMTHRIEILERLRLAIVQNQLVELRAAPGTEAEARS